MFRTGSERREQESLLLSKRSLETSPSELGQLLAYVLRLRSCWKPEGRAKLVVPTCWTEFLLAFADDECEAECIVGRCHPFRHVRFESGTETRLAAPGEELPRDFVSQALEKFGRDDCLATFLPRAFEGIPHTRLRSDIPHAATRPFSRGHPRRIDFALVPEDGSDDTETASPESNARCLLFGMRGPGQMQHSPSGPRTFTPIPEELTSQGQFHLRLLVSLTQREAVGPTTGSFPEWLVLFGLIYDAHRVRVVAYVPRRRASNVIECAAYVVDELTFHPVSSTPKCELALECLRLLLVLSTLRRHVHRLSKSLSTTIGSRDGVRQTDDHPSLPSGSTHNQHDSDGSESDCSSAYSTCPSSVRTRELDDVPVLKCEQELSSCRSFTSSFCSTCFSLLESTSTSNPTCSEDSNFMEPSVASPSRGSNGSVRRPHKLTETKKRDIIAWAWEVVPTEHPVKDSYRMIIYHPHPRRRGGSDFVSGTRK